LLRDGDEVESLSSRGEASKDRIICVVRTQVSSPTAVVRLFNGLRLSPGHPVLTHATSGRLVSGRLVTRQSSSPLAAATELQAPGIDWDVVALSEVVWAKPRALVAGQRQQQNGEGEACELLRAGPGPCLPFLFNFVTASRGPLLVSGPPPRGCSPAADACDPAGFVVCSTLGQFCPGVDQPASFFGSERVVRALQCNEEWPFVTAGLPCPPLKRSSSRQLQHK
jgi:hypothetical protein